MSVAILSCGTSSNMNGSKSLLTNKYWKLTELNGKVVTTDPSSSREAHIIFQDTATRVGGNAGCNQFGGSYTLPGNNRIQFSQMFSTKMYCEKMMETETAFLNMLEKATSYSLDGDSVLLLHNESGQLARLSYVPGKTK